MIGVDLFAGAGGMSVGALMAGVKVAIAVEKNPHAAATYRWNHLDVDIITSDIRNVSQLIVERKGHEVVVFGGPPCEGFSTSNQRTRSYDNPKNWLFMEFLRIVGEVEPDWVVFENVKGILETENGAFFREILSGLSQLGYTVSHGVLNAADFGVPQRRWRVFVIGSRSGINVAMPEPTVARPTTVREAISDLPRLSNGASKCCMAYRPTAPTDYAAKLRRHQATSRNHLITRNSPEIIERYRHIRPGGNWKDIPAELMENYKNLGRCHTGIYRRLKWDEPSVVIGNYRKNMLIHPSQDRGLSVREAARLQSFPDRFEFHGSIGFQQQQVGNAVCPLLAKAVFDTIRRCRERVVC